MNKKIIILMSVLLAGALSYSFFSESEVSFVRAYDMIPESYDRNFESIDITQTSNFTDTTLVLVPASLRLYKDKVYISDFSDFTIYEYSTRGVFSRKLETGKGRGPGEFEHLTDFDLINDTLWAVDSNNLRISSFSFESGEFITSFSVDRRPSKITCLTDGIIIQWTGTEELFSKFDYDGNELKHFGTIIENQLQDPLSLTGVLTSNGKINSFIFLCMQV